MSVATGTIGMSVEKIIASPVIAAMLLGAVSPVFAQAARPSPGVSTPGVGAGTGAGAAAVGGLTLQETILLSVLALGAVATGGVLLAEAVKNDDPVSP